MKTSLLVLFFASLGAQAADTPHIYAIDSEMGGIESIYTKPLVALLKASPTFSALVSPDAAKDTNPVKIQAYETPGNDLFIGVGQSMTINAPLAVVEAVLDDFPNYKNIFDGLEEVKVLEKEGNRSVVFLEQHIGIPFVANEKNDMIYLMDHSSPHKKVYRYQVRKSVHMISNDGVIVIEALSPTVTSYMEFDFWDAHWGLAKAVKSNNGIWEDNVEGLYNSDLTVKLKSEHPDWSNHKIKDAAKEGTDKANLGERVKHKIRFEFLKK